MIAKRARAITNRYFILEIRYGKKAAIRCINSLIKKSAKVGKHYLDFNENYFENSSEETRLCARTFWVNYISVREEVQQYFLRKGFIAKLDTRNDVHYLDIWW